MGRPPSRTGLNDATQRELVWWLAKGLSKEDAAKRAGLPSSGRLYHFARTRDFADALREGLVDHMSNELAPKAVRILDEIMSDEKVTSRVRVDAAKAILDRSGYAATPPGGRPDDTPIREMSVDQLRRLVTTLEEAQVLSGKIIDGELVEEVKATPELDDLIE